ncbi:hypothetical protein DLM78_08150 [Leptospira stimsonii]|uniref:Uncharacterized protein n=1 Tax=Leptospira stimsonii TaxID=2202203 RepID=A0A8B3CXP9_9LEPT|nr:hypothetical protein DLM78_08150 [Leptospira stimsonii]
MRMECNFFLGFLSKKYVQENGSNGSDSNSVCFHASKKLLSYSLNSNDISILFFCIVSDPS